MGLKNAFAAVICTALLGWSSLSAAEEYRANEFLSLDLSKALLSPKRLAPETRLAPAATEVPAATEMPVATEATADRASPAAQARVQPKAEPKSATPRPRVTQQHADKPRGAARSKLTRRHGNPLDAQASDTRIQVWPCKSGGICNWRR